MRVLLIAGAGTSVELGVPGMVGLADEFLSHAEQWNVEPELARTLLSDVRDVEVLIEGLDQLTSARPHLERLGALEVPSEAIDKLRAEIEWFVQHAAERLTPSDARLIWGPVLRAAHGVQLTVVTTNYDRAIELAANAEQVPIQDGFEVWGGGETARWIGFDESASRIPVVKLHGSTDWYSDVAEDAPLKLRHPMPLFGRATLRISDGRQLGSAMILPSREKLLTREPYPRLSQTFLNAVDNCDVAVVVGSSMRDPHLKGAVNSVAGRAPVFIVNPSGDTYGVAGAAHIAQPASTFLASTLPNALLASDPTKRLAGALEERRGDVSTLDALRRLTADSSDSGVRCAALDALDSKRAPLSPEALEHLLGQSDPSVARYSLGLVRYSVRAPKLMRLAADSPHVDDAAFAQELELLRALVAQDATEIEMKEETSLESPSSAAPATA